MAARSTGKEKKETAPPIPAAELIKEDIFS